MNFLGLVFWEVFEYVWRGLIFLWVLGMLLVLFYFIGKIIIEELK